ncbi:hypothetical protein PENTCL1PPCAC_12101, partial [Pristionchus entomophagus]
TLLGENILQLANRLQQKQQLLYGDSPSSSSPPPSTSIDGLFPIKEEIRDDEPATPPPSQSHTDSEPSPPILNQQQSTLLSALNAMNSSPQPPAGQSPWMRNAGRKKSHPVWEFFRDLKLENGSSSVLCLHCGWTGEDRSPNNLRTHLKKSHTHDGVFQKFSERLANTPTQPYVKRVRAGGLLHSSSSQQQSVVQQLQHTLQLPGNDIINIDEMMSNFLDSIPKMEEVINITASFSTPADHDDDGTNVDGTELVASRSSSSPSTSDPAPPSSPALSINNHQAPAVSGPIPTTTVPNLAGLNSMMMASNPLLFMSALANASNGVSTPPSSSSSSSTPPFSLTDASCVSILMKMAGDLDLTFSYHKRRGEAEITFESNRTAEKSGGRGKIVAISDIGKDIRVTERVNGANTESELWTKTDVQQFQWAIRGKCTKLLK